MGEILQPEDNGLECLGVLGVYEIFWDQDGVLLIDYLPKGQTINAEY
jgi:hypothetical protein